MIEPLAAVVRELAEHQTGLVTHVHKLSEAGAAERESVYDALTRMAEGAAALDATREEMAARLQGFDRVSDQLSQRLDGLDRTRADLADRLSGLDDTRTAIDARLRALDDAAKSLKKLKIEALKPAKAATIEAGGARALFQRLTNSWAPVRDESPSERALIDAMTEQQRAYQERISADLAKLGDLISSAKRDAA